MKKIILDCLWNCPKKTFIKRWLLISLFFIIIASIFSIDFYDGLELTQNIEFASYKYGKSPIEGVNIVEFNHKLARWIVPAINYVEIVILEKIGINDPFIQAIFFRLTWGLIGLYAVYLLMLVSFLITKNENKSKVIVVLFSILPFIPYFLVRGGNTTFSGTLLAIAISLYILHSANKETPSNIGFSLSFIIGLIFGLSVVVRMQTLPFVGGFYLQFFFFSSKNKFESFTRLLVVSFGALLSLFAGFFIDSWGYGEWTNTLWNYFDFNVIKDLAKNWGSEPFYAYFYLIPDMFREFIIIPIIVIIGFVIFWIRNPKSIITWTTLPFVLSHFFIARKDARFIVPIFLFIPIVLVKAFYFDKGFISEFYNSFLKKIGTKILRIFVSLFFLGCIFLFFYTVNKGPFRETMDFQRYVYYNFKDGFKGYTADKAGSEYPFDLWVKSYFYRPSNLEIKSIENIDVLEEILKKEESFYLIVQYTNLKESKDNNFSFKEVFSIKYDNFIESRVKKLIKYSINKLKKNRYDMSAPNPNVCALYFIERKK